MPRTFFLGLDVSTTGAKALLVDEAGVVVSSATTPLPLSTPKPLWSEQDPHDWWDGIVQSIRQALAKASATGDDVKAVGLTGQMHGLTLLDDAGEVLRPAILWNDQRTGAQCDEIRARVGKARFIQITGNDALTGFTAPKILWVREHEPEVYARVRQILLPKDYIRYRLTGDLWHGQSRCGGHGAVRSEGARLVARSTGGAGDSLRLAAHDVRRPRGHEHVSAQTAAELTGLKAGTPVVGGGGDQAAGAVGVGAVEPGIVSLAGHLRRRLRLHGRALYRARGPAPRLLPRRAGDLALDGRDALRCRQPAVVSRHPGAGRLPSTTSPPQPPESPRVRKGCSSCPTSPANAPPTPTRWRGQASSG